MPQVRPADPAPKRPADPVPPPAPGPAEDPSDLDALARAWRRRRPPADAAEALALDELVACLWRRRQLAALEIAVLGRLARGEEAGPLPRLETLLRYGQRLLRSREAVLAELDALRRDRPTSEPASARPASARSGSERPLSARPASEEQAAPEPRPSAPPPRPTPIRTPVPARSESPERARKLAGHAAPEAVSGAPFEPLPPSRAHAAPELLRGEPAGDPLAADRPWPGPARHAAPEGRAALLVGVSETALLAGLDPDALGPPRLPDGA